MYLLILICVTCINIVHMYVRGYLTIIVDISKDYRIF